MHKKILIPFDGRSTAAIKHAVAIAKKEQSKVTIFHVVPAINPMLNKYGDRFNNDSGILNKNRLQNEGKTLLKQACDQNIRDYQRVETKLAWGNPAQEICKEAKEGQYDLIVMSSRNLRRITGYLLGSVSNKVIKSAKCPVLIVNQ